MTPKDLHDYQIVLASKSPRRHALLKEMGLTFTVQTKNTHEQFPEKLVGAAIVQHLCEQKADAFTQDELPENFLLITADTIVVAHGEVLNKAADAVEATAMLHKLSGRRHSVITGVGLRSSNQQRFFYDEAEVRFARLQQDEIQYYVQHFQPFDKAGAYGIQDWIGLIGIEAIKGSYFTVMGLPTFKLWQELKRFVKHQSMPFMS